ncbi:ATP-dependent (S)-NAD(P)H-hydrate dehydratase-like [Macrosteles quadrilineatus]|uniref:ATP-dependent (S)-NAD(P)H-hydrate dehydratase-like n=1 Tax=Macrosteles quadrilineatus TaxID=74068 RepID=UPI0023E2CD9D|nr:ATP-dependent (S)-NAD(P)H-hydrate dehydratase-like [Macrosteles quadrilineatus]
MFLYISSITLCLSCGGVYSVNYTSGKADKAVLEECKNFIPHLSTKQHKGDRGRIGVFGGSEEYTGPPYFGAMASLRTGTDMVYLFCASPAAIPIKSYGPELMVLPCLDSKHAFSKIKPWLERIHGVLIGPGLGRNETVVKNIVKMIGFLKEDVNSAIPMVFDADAFYIMYSNPELLQEYPKQVYLTPNYEEFRQLVSVVLGISQNSVNPHEHLKALAEKLGPKVTIVLKGKVDKIAQGDSVVTSNKMTGSPRRCGGQGDMLAGCLAALAVWQDMAETWRPQVHLTQEQIVGYAASALLKLANEMAYKEKGRSLIASDILSKLHPAFDILFDEL